MDRYWITYNNVGALKDHPGGLIHIHINKNPGSYDRDPHYPVLKEYDVMRLFWNLLHEMPDANIEIIE